MSIIDRQRIEAVKTLEALGYVFRDNHWQRSGITLLLAEADAMHAMLIECADKLDGCPEGSDEEKQYEAIADLASAYEAKRWPNGKAECGKG